MISAPASSRIALIRSREMTLGSKVTEKRCQPSAGVSRSRSTGSPSSALATRARRGSVSQGHGSGTSPQTATLADAGGTTSTVEVVGGGTVAVGTSRTAGSIPQPSSRHSVMLESCSRISTSIISRAVIAPPLALGLP